MIFSKQIENAILEKENKLKNDKIDRLLEHIRKHLFVKEVKKTENGIAIKLLEEVTESPSEAAKMFITGGRLRKKSSSGKDKIDVADFFFVEKFKG